MITSESQHPHRIYLHETSKKKQTEEKLVEFVFYIKLSDWMICWIDIQCWKHFFGGMVWDDQQQIEMAGASERTNECAALLVKCRIRNVMFADISIDM